MKNVDLDEPTAFLDRVYLGCTQRECKPDGKLWRNIQRCLNHVFLLEQLKNYWGGKSHAKTAACSYDMERHARKCVERYCELANKKVEQL